MKISLCMIVKNEEENIISCLDRALEIVDEAIVVDTGSTDNTIELMIGKYGQDNKVKIIEDKWENDFSKARNKSLEHATGDWILVLDADERIFCDRNTLEEFLKSNKGLAYRLAIYNIFDKNNFTVSTSMIRIYKNNNPEYKGAIHEQIVIDGKLYPGEVLDENICRIYHYGYNPNVMMEKDKIKRNMDIINEEIKKHPNDPFNRYNKGVMEMVAGNYDTALDDFIKAHTLTNNVRMSYHNDLLIRMIQCMIMQKNYKQAANFIEDISKDSYIGVIPDVYYYLGICYTKLEEYDKAINSYKKAVNIGEYSEGISKFGVGSFLSLIEWAKTLELKNEKMLAIEKYKEAVFNSNNFGRQGLAELKRLLKEENMLDKLEQLDKDISSTDNKAKIIGNTDELNNIKKDFKDNIQLLIESGMLKEAKETIEEYEKIVKNDVDMYSIKGVIAMMEGDMDEAEKQFKKGLKIDDKYYDLLYNLAYLYQLKELNELAIIYYKKALRNANDSNDVDEIYEILKELGVNDGKEQILEENQAEAYYAVAYDFNKEGNLSDATLNYGLACRYAKDKNFKANIQKLYESCDGLKSIFDVAANDTKKRFIILSSCGWADVYQRMHHISRSLAKYEHEVIYITPAMVVNVSSESINISDLTKHSYNNFKVVDKVKIYSPILALYNQKQIANNYIDLVQSILDSSTDSSQTIIITYMPYQSEVIESLEGKFFHIYECVDDHSDLEYAFWGNKKDIIWEQELMDKADAITTTAISLFLQRKAIEGRQNVYLSRNAVNESDFIFNDQLDIPEDLKNIPKPRIVYIGAIYEWFDTELFYQVVKSNPDKSFVIIGFGKDNILKERYPNLYILGARKHSELKKYLRHMDIGIIPFKSDIDIIINCDPIKHYEYIACGLPVITTFMPEAAIDKINTFLADTKERFNKYIEECLKFKSDRKAISTFLAQNSWNARAALLCRLADGNINKEEQNKTLQNIKSKLSDMTKKYKSPIFRTLEAVCFSMHDSKKYEEYLKQAYDIFKEKYIEKQYLTALLRNNNMPIFIDIVLNSLNIKEELKQELLYRKNNNYHDCVNIISHICIRDIKKAMFLTDSLVDEKLKCLYKIFIRYMLGENISHHELCSISENDSNSPLLRLLEDNLSLNKEVKTKRNHESFVRDYVDNKVLLSKTKIVSIVGYFGENNAGDEALLASLLDRLNDIPFIQPVVIAFNNPDQVTRLHNVKAIAGGDFENVNKVISISDLVILGPGGLIEDYARLDAKHLFNPQGMYQYLYPIIMSQLYDKLTIGYGLGVGPLHLKQSKNAVKLALNGMDKIYVRDVRSLSLLEEIGLRNAELSADAVLNLKLQQNDTRLDSKTEKNKTIIGISLRPFIDIDIERLLKELSIFMLHMMEDTNIDFALIPMQYVYDMPVIKKLYDLIISRSEFYSNRIRIIDDGLHPRTLMEYINTLDLMIGMRLHSIIMASALNKPFIAIEYDPKVSEFAKALSMDEYVIKANEVDGDNICKKAISLLHDKEILIQLTSAVKSQKALEDKAWSYVKNLLLNM